MLGNLKPRAALCFGVLLLCQLAGAALAQTPPASDPPEDAPATVFPHSESSRHWLSGQANIILQWHPSFRSPYAGANSLRPAAENTTSRVFTLYTGLRLTHTTEVIFDLESAGGKGLGDALGLAGFTNLDVVRNPELGAKPYVARAMLRQIIPLSRERVLAARGPLGLATQLPARRIELRLGKFSLPDFFDLNSVGSDSRLQFLNWTADNNGAYDYAADTRGYTVGVLVEYQDRRWGLRFAEALMPRVANGIDFEWKLSRARSENIEVEIRRSLLPRRQGAARLLAFVNHANMGSYREAVDAFLAGRTPVPDVTAHPRQTRIKYGFGVNLEQALNGWLSAYGRWGWNEGRHESFAYTEVDQTVAFGAAASGVRWRRKLDRAGATLISNGISRQHQRYLALGGRGFLLGDGRLTYGRELIFEGYYTIHLCRGLFASLDLQRVANPGYNRDRGPVLVPALRLHVEF